MIQIQAQGGDGWASGAQRAVPSSARPSLLFVPLMKLTGLSKFHGSQSMCVYLLFVTAVLHPMSPCRKHREINAVGKQPLLMAEHVHIRMRERHPHSFWQEAHVRS